MSTHFSIHEARINFSEIINRSLYAKERISILRRGKEVAAIIPIEDLDFIEALEDRIDILESLAALEEAGRLGTKSWAEVKAEIGLNDSI